MMHDQVFARIFQELDVGKIGSPINQRRVIKARGNPRRQT
jgi:hypothetical protein